MQLNPCKTKLSKNIDTPELIIVVVVDVVIEKF